ncbi:hypothetical protein NP233_g10833 [Leucocoprinus birnbaumii]|uniref:Uncharacterized protein n=1 Tax=Leucocoprinus birnbaumii TaxID=56174 RepID=A0AAD5VL97_9AGAR|nr:hypothetical protein NP233_g10833 [Leucocoprinus birnbaumii]
MPYVSKIKQTLIGHSRAINALKFSTNCSVLLSSGDDASVIIWNLRSSNNFQVIQVPLQGPVSAIIWTPLQRVAKPAAFVFGCTDRTLFLCEKTSFPPYVHEYHICSTYQSFDEPVEDLAFDKDHCRLAAVSRQGIKLVEIDEKGCFVKLASEESRDKFLPRGVAFIEEGKQVIVGFMELHEIAHMAIDPASTAIMISNLEKELELYTLPLEQVPVQVATMSFPRKITRRGIPLLTSIDDQAVVGGTDYGAVEVFEQSHRGEPHVLEHWNHGMGGGGDCVVRAFPSQCPEK